MNTILKTSLMIAVAMGTLAEARPVPLSEVRAKNAHCLMGDYFQSGIIPELRRLTLPQAPRVRLTLQKGPDLFGRDRWVATSSYWTTHYPGAYHFQHFFDTAFYRRGHDLQLFNNVENKPAVSIVAHKVPFIYYKKWVPKYDTSKSLVEAQTTVADFYVELETEPGPVEFENTKTGLLLELTVPLQNYVACLQKAVKDLEAISAR